MRGLNLSTSLVIIVSLACLVTTPGFALAYTGPGPALELVPFFYSLLVWVTLALSSVLLWPLNALILRLRKRGEKPVAQGQQAPAA
jgi:hypothetical protein